MASSSPVLRRTALSRHWTPICCAPLATVHCIALQPLAKPCMTPRMRCARRYKETRSHTLMRVPARAHAAVGRSVACRADGSEALSRGAAFGAVRNKGGLRDAFTIRNCWDGYAYEVAFQLHDPYIEVLRSATSSNCHAQHATYASDATHLPCSMRLECNTPPPLGAAMPCHSTHSHSTIVLHSHPLRVCAQKIEIVVPGKSRRAKLYYLRYGLRPRAHRSAAQAATAATAALALPAPCHCSRRPAVASLVNEQNCEEILRVRPSRPALTLRRANDLRAHSCASSDYTARVRHASRE